jgi:hypothetical protein
VVLGATDTNVMATAFRPQALRVLDFIRKYATAHMDVAINAASSLKTERVTKADVKRAAKAEGIVTPSIGAAYVAFHAAFVADLAQRLSDKVPAGSPSLVADLRALVNAGNATPLQFARTAMREYAQFALTVYHSAGFDSELSEETLVELLGILDVLPLGANTRSMQVDHLWYYFGKDHSQVHAGLGSPLRFLVAEATVQQAPQPPTRQWMAVRAIPSGEAVAFEADDAPQLRLSTNVAKAAWISRQDEGNSVTPRVPGRVLTLNAPDQCLLPPTPTLALAHYMHTIVASTPIGGAAFAGAGAIARRRNPIEDSAPSSPIGAGGSPSMLSPSPHSPLPTASESATDKLAEQHRKIEVYLTEAVTRMGKLEQDEAGRRSLGEEERTALVSVVATRVKEIRTTAAALQKQSDEAAVNNELARLRSKFEQDDAETRTSVNQAFAAIESRRQKALRDTSELERLISEGEKQESDLLGEI